ELANQNVGLASQEVTPESPLLGIEPSAIITFRDEYPELVDESKREEARKLGENALMIDEFLVKEIKAGRIHSEQFTSKTQKIKLHGHCYQKAFKLVEATKELLSFPTNYEVEVIP